MPISATPSINAPRFEKRLGSLIFQAGANSLGPITIPPVQILTIEYVITAYGGGGDIMSFQFGNASTLDTTAANYGSWFSFFSNAAPPVNSQSAPNAGSIAMIPVSGVSQTVGRRGRLIISNVQARRKVIDITTANESATSTGPSLERGWGEWLNTTDQIQQIKIVTVSNNNVGAGSFIIIYGDNP
jgi:hypothetical protein